MPKLTAASMEQRRTRIIDAAVRCFMQHGFAVTSVDDVCAEGGFSKGAFYVHFPTKDALVHAVMDQRANDVGPIDDNSIESLAASIFDHLIAPTMNRAHSRFGLESLAACNYDDVMRGKTIDTMENIRGAIEDAIHSLIARGAARSDCDPATVAAILQRYVLGTVTRQAIWTEEREAEMRDSVRLLVDSLLAGHC